MKIAGVEYSIATRSLDIYISGCKAEPKCNGCHNPELWDFKAGAPFDAGKMAEITQMIKDNDILIDNIFIMGGEPLDQEWKYLEVLLEALAQVGKYIWVFTRFELNEIDVDRLRPFVDYIKTGRYDDKQLSKDNIQFGVKLASSNQRVWRISK